MPLQLINEKKHTLEKIESRLRCIPVPLVLLYGELVKMSGERKKDNSLLRIRSDKYQTSDYRPNNYYKPISKIEIRSNEK